MLLPLAVFALAAAVLAAAWLLARAVRAAASTLAPPVETLAEPPQRNGLTEVQRWIDSAEAAGVPPTSAAGDVAAGAAKPSSNDVAPPRQSLGFENRAQVRTKDMQLTADVDAASDADLYDREEARRRLRELGA